MSSFAHRLSLAAALLMVLTASSLAQSTPPAAESSARTFTALAWFDTIEDLRIPAKTRLERITIPTGSRSMPAKFTGDKIEFYREVMIDGKPSRALALAVPVPHENRQPLVVLYADRHSRAGQPVDPATVNYRALVLDDAPDRFPAGSMHLLNHTSGPLAVKFGNGQAEIAPGDGKIVPGGLDPSSDVPFKLAVSLAENGGWRLLINTFFASENQQRLLVFVRPDENGNPQPVILTDRVPPPVPVMAAK